MVQILGTNLSLEKTILIALISIFVIGIALNTLKIMFYKIRSVLEKESKRRKFYEMSN